MTNHYSNEFYLWNRGSFNSGDKVETSPTQQSNRLDTGYLTTQPLSKYWCLEVITTEVEITYIRKMLCVHLQWNYDVKKLAFISKKT